MANVEKGDNGGARVSEWLPAAVLADQADAESFERSNGCAWVAEQGLVCLSVCYTFTGLHYQQGVFCLLQSPTIELFNAFDSAAVVTC